MEMSIHPTQALNVQETLNILLTKTNPKLKQHEIAARLHCTQPHISYLLNTKAPNARPSASVVEGLRQLRAEHAYAFEAEKAGDPVPA